MEPVRYAALRAAGWSRWQITQALESGRLRRVRSGWYEQGPGSSQAGIAVAAGARIGCLTGLKEKGVWVPPTTHPHLLAPRWHDPPRTGLVHQLRRGDPWTRAPVFDVIECLQQVFRFHDPETCLVVLESACHLGLVTPVDARLLVAGCPARLRARLEAFELRSESGTETRVRSFLQRLRFDVRVQVPLRGIGRVDLLVGRSLIIECDSRAHHTGEESYRRDRSRDLVSVVGGYVVVRLTWEMVWLDWENTQQMLLSLLRTRVHRHLPRAA